MAAIIQFTSAKEIKSECIILTVTDGNIAAVKNNVPKAVYTRIEHLSNKGADGFDGKQGSIVSFSHTDGDQFAWYVLVGIKIDATQIDIEKAGGKLYAHVSGMKIEKAAVIADLSEKNAASLANGFYLRSYEFNKYKTRNLDKLNKTITLSVIVDDKTKAEKAYKSMKVISDAVFVARDFVNEPPNTLYPESYVEMIKKALKKTDVKITVFDDRKLEKMGAGALLAVGKGSERKPRLVIFEYDGRTKKDKNERPLALVGKGVTYDTGGYSLKPRESMATMKMDMGGSAAVVGAFKALAENNIDKYVVGAIALAENMIAANAYRVDDIVVSLSGQTIEVINTDAEGRLCLADALTYIQDKYDPKAVVDAATLTGACMAALGLDIAGVFSNTKELETSFWESGKSTGDEFWPLPVNKDFDKQIDSPIADMRNLGSNPFAGASTAAVFLQRFITNDRPWAHLDIAGTAWRKDDSAICPKGASGFGVRAFYHWVVNS